MPDIDRLREPRRGPVDPGQCPVCAELRDSVGTVIATGNPIAARAVVLAMREHMLHAHGGRP